MEGMGAGRAVSGLPPAADPAFWRRRRVLITGHTGFKGGWLSLWLDSLGAEVGGFSLGVPTAPSLYAVARVGEGLAWEQDGDIRALGPLRDALESFAPEVVLHLAAQPLVRRSYAEPLETYATNVMGTAHVLEAVRGCPTVRAVVVVTTDKCYENREWEWGYREDEPMGGHDPYSSSKGAAELVTAAYRRSFFDHPDGPRVASARAGNVIGGGDWGEERLIPDVVQAAQQDEGLEIRNPAAIRPWQHVLNPLSGYLQLAQRLWEDPAAATAWNFGPEEADARSVSWIVEELRRRWGGRPAWRHEPAPLHEAQYLKLDSSRARQRLGWRPVVRLEAALDSIVEWHEAHAAGEDMRALTLRQIAELTA